MFDVCSSFHSRRKDVNEMKYRHSPIANLLWIRVFWYLSKFSFEANINYGLFSLDIQNDTFKFHHDYHNSSGQINVNTSILESLKRSLCLATYFLSFSHENANSSSTCKVSVYHANASYISYKYFFVRIPCKLWLTVVPMWISCVYSCIYIWQTKTWK